VDSRRKPAEREKKSLDDSDSPFIFGVISDTHGLLRPAAIEALRGSHRILHAGDIGSADILDALATLARVTAIRGNVDRAEWARRLPETEVVEEGGCSIYILHDLAQLDLNPEAAKFNVVLYGHSHQPKIEHKGSVLYLNPGSAGPRRFNLPVSVAKLRVGRQGIQAEIIDLKI
jgi:uncharacterized protein